MSIKGWRTLVVAVCIVASATYLGALGKLTDLVLFAYVIANATVIGKMVRDYKITKNGNGGTNETK